jgi:TonB family protein
MATISDTSPKASFETTGTGVPPTRTPFQTGIHQPNGLFQPLEHVDSRGRAFWTSVGFHVVMLLVLLAVPMIFTETLKVKYDVVLVAPPPPDRQILEVTHWKQPKPLPRPPEKIVAPPPQRPLVTEVSPPEPRKIAEVKLPEVIEREKLVPLAISPARINEPETPQLEPPKIEVRTNVFSTGSSAKPTLNLPAHEVQTGGFGDPNGVRGEGRPDKPANVASLGSFDLPVGAGAGNGTGGAHGARGTVVSAGFGNGVAPVGTGNATLGRSVRQGSFGDAQNVQPTAAPKKRDSGPPQTPVDIVFKPRPEYTEEARSIKLEGEVLLRVLFTAAGEVRVIDVIRGLGHGLDENATRAAQQIRFKPALRDGEPIDSTATVRIVFQLAY